MDCDEDSEDFPPPPSPTAPPESAAPTRENPARGTPVGNLLGRALRRGQYAPDILRVLEQGLGSDRSAATTTHNDSDAADVSTSLPRVAATALVEEPTNAIPAPHAPGKTSQVNWADNEAFHFNPEAHCLSTVPSASLLKGCSMAPLDVPVGLVRRCLSERDTDAPHVSA